MKIKRFLIILIIVFFILLVIIFWMAWKGYQLQKGAISITTDKTEYEKGGVLKVKIKSNFGENICFSSCYPYLLERKNEKWESYEYAECQKFNGNGSCIEARKEKAFELTLPEAPEGLHRLAVPICINCKSEDPFEEDKRFYSNEFTIKEKMEKETFAVYLMDNFESKVTIYGVSIPLDKSEALKVYQTIYGAPTCWIVDKRVVECPVEKTKYGWQISVGYLGLNQSIISIYEEERIVKYFPGE